MSTEIRSNGSKWAGEAPDSIEKLIAVLAIETLDPRFEDSGNFAREDETSARFFGNFLTVSHVFSITSTDRDVIDSLTAAIRANQATDAYKQAREDTGTTKRFIHRWTMSAKARCGAKGNLKMSSSGVGVTCPMCLNEGA